MGVGKRPRQPGVRRDDHAVPARGGVDRPSPAAEQDRLVAEPDRADLGFDRPRRQLRGMGPGPAPRLPARRRGRRGGQLGHVVAADPVDGGLHHLAVPRWPPALAALAHPGVGCRSGRCRRVPVDLPVPGTGGGCCDSHQGEPDRRRGAEAPRGCAVRDDTSADPVVGACRSGRRLSQVSPGDRRCPAAAEVVDGCRLHRGGALRPEHADVPDARVPDVRWRGQRCVHVLPDLVDHLLRTDPDRHRNRDHQAQALRHRCTDQPRTGGRDARCVRHRAVRRHRGRRRHADRAAPAVGLAVGAGDRPGGRAVPAGATTRAPAREPARLRVAGHAVRGALRLLGQHGRALHHQGAAPADGADRLGVPRRRPRRGLAAHRARDGA